MPTYDDPAHEIAHLRQTLNKANHWVRATKNKAVGLMERIDEMTHEIMDLEKLKPKLAMSETTLLAVKKERDSLMVERDVARASTDKYSSQVLQLTGELDEARRRIDGLLREHANQSMDEFAKLKEEYAELEDSLAGQEEQIQKLAGQRDELKREVEYKDKRIASLLAGTKANVGVINWGRICAGVNGVDQSGNIHLSEFLHNSCLESKPKNLVKHWTNVHNNGNIFSEFAVFADEASGYGGCRVYHRYSASDAWRECKDINLWTLVSLMLGEMVEYEKEIRAEKDKHESDLKQLARDKTILPNNVQEIADSKKKDNALIDELLQEIKRLETANICNSIECKQIFAILSEKAGEMKKKTGTNFSIISTLHYMADNMGRFEKWIKTLQNQVSGLNDTVGVCRREIADRVIEVGRLRRDNATMRGQLRGSKDERFIARLIEQCRNHKKKWKSLKETLDTSNRATKI